MASTTYERARDLEPVRGETLPRGRSLAGGEVRAIFEALAQDERPIAGRDACALALLVGAGIRRSELADLQLGRSTGRPATSRSAAGPCGTA